MRKSAPCTTGSATHGLSTSDPMSAAALKCPTCGLSLEAGIYNSGNSFDLCRGCGEKVAVRAYPALYRRAEAPVAAQKANLDDAACYYHADKKAQQVCDECGRFLCALCELPLDGETLCASCLELRRKQPGRHVLKPRQMRYDKLAISLAILPLLYFPLTFLTAPATLFVVLRYWKKDLEFSPGRKARMVLAFIIGLCELIGWITLIVVLIGKKSHGR